MALFRLDETRETFRLVIILLTCVVAAALLGILFCGCSEPVMRGAIDVGAAAALKSNTPGLVVYFSFRLLELTGPRQGPPNDPSIARPAAGPALKGK